MILSVVLVLVAIIVVIVAAIALYRVGNEISVLTATTAPTAEEMQAALDSTKKGFLWTIVFVGVASLILTGLMAFTSGWVSAAMFFVTALLAVIYLAVQYKLISNADVGESYLKLVKLSLVYVIFGAVTSIVGGVVGLVRAYRTRSGKSTDSETKALNEAGGKGVRGRGVFPSNSNNFWGALAGH